VLACCGGILDAIGPGSTKVIICGKPAARMGDMTMHGGNVIVGHPLTLIG
jgi:uncharacterized Zn-binding protein involved in type VI secretion